VRQGVIHFEKQVLRLKVGRNRSWAIQKSKDPVQEVPALRPWPSKLFVETTTRCNLNFIMCVKQTWDRTTMEGDMTDETFAALESAFSHLEALILNRVGDLFGPRLEEFVRRAKELMPEGAGLGSRATECS
jgi:hypothetical protein